MWENNAKIFSQSALFVFPPRLPVSYRDNRPGFFLSDRTERDGAEDTAACGRIPEGNRIHHVRFDADFETRVLTFLKTYFNSSPARSKSWRCPSHESWTIFGRCRVCVFFTRIIFVRMWSRSSFTVRILIRSFSFGVGDLVLVSKQPRVESLLKLVTLFRSYIRRTSQYLLLILGLTLFSWIFVLFLLVRLSSERHLRIESIPNGKLRIEPIEK